MERASGETWDILMKMHLQCLVVHLVGVRGCGFKVSSAQEWSRTSPTASPPVQDTSSPAKNITPLASGVQELKQSALRGTFV